MLGREFLDQIKTLQLVTYVGLEDLVDKLNFLVTVGLLLICTTIVTVKTYFISPLECTLMSAVEGNNLKDYVSTVCWTEGTYAIRPQEYHSLEIGPKWEGMEEFRQKYASRLIFYYQWVPFVLGLQCILFYLPHLMWQMITYNKTGTDLGHLVTQANDAVHADSEKRKNIVRHLVHTIEQLLYLHREYRVGKIARVRRHVHNVCKVLPSKRLGTSLVFMYLIVKIMYIVNCVGQLYLMQRFLSMGNSTSGVSLNFGYQLLHDLTNGREWTNSLVFPRISFCAFTVKGSASVLHLMAQCALPINMLNEKLYIFLWFWIVVCGTLTAMSMPIWIARMMCFHLRTKFIKRFLKLSVSLKKPTKNDMNKFVNEFLRHDGTFLVRMIALNAGDLICSEIVIGLYEVYYQHHYGIDFRGPNESDESDKCNIALTLEGSKASLRRGMHLTPSAPTFIAGIDEMK